MRSIGDLTPEEEKELDAAYASLVKEEPPAPVEIVTPLGKLNATIAPDPNYPGINVMLNGRSLAWVEVNMFGGQDHNTPTLQVLAWKKHFDDHEEATKIVIDLTPIEEEES